MRVHADRAQEAGGYRRETTPEHVHETTDVASIDCGHDEGNPLYPARFGHRPVEDGFTLRSAPRVSAAPKPSRPSPADDSTPRGPYSATTAPLPATHRQAQPPSTQLDPTHQASPTYAFVGCPCGLLIKTGHSHTALNQGKLNYRRGVKAPIHT